MDDDWVLNALINQQLEDLITVEADNQGMVDFQQMTTINSQALKLIDGKISPDEYFDAVRMIHCDPYAIEV